MLFNSHMCKVLSQNFYVHERKYFESNIFASDCQLLMTVRELFNADKKIESAFAQQAFTALAPLCKLIDDDLTLRQEQLAIYGVFLSNLVYGYDTQEENVQKRFCLYTTSLSILKQMANSGLLKGKKDPIDVELPKIEKTLYHSNRIKTYIEDGKKILAVRLDFELRSDGTPVFFPTIPRSPLEIGRHVFVVQSTVNEAVERLSDLLRQKVLRITMGDKVRAVTLNNVVLESLFGAPRAQFLLSARKDIRTMSFYIPSVEASIYSAGVTNIRLAEIDKVEIVDSIADLDLSALKFNYAMIKPFFYESLRNMPAKGLLSVAEDFDETTTVDFVENDPYDFIVKKTMRTGGHVLLEYMKRRSDIFDIKACMSQKNIYGDEYEQVTIPREVDDLRKLMTVGTFKVLIQKRDGTYSSLICTNSHRELVRVLGVDYIKYESEGVRFNALSKYIKNRLMDSDKLEDYKNACAAYDLVDFYFGVLQDIDHSKAVTAQYWLDQIDKTLLNIDMRKTVINQPHLVTVRNLSPIFDSEGKAIDFYKNIDPMSVVDLVCLNTVKQAN